MSDMEIDNELVEELAGALGESIQSVKSMSSEERQQLIQG